MRDWINQPHVGDCRGLLREMRADKVQVQCVITSPPYWGGLRDYGHKGQFGLEAKPALHIRRMVQTFRLVREVLKPNGTLWLNYGDTYMHSGGRGSQGKGERQFRRQPKVRSAIRYSKQRTGLKSKDLVGMPWRIALALQEDGWYLRSCVIWHKSNPMPESTKDRPTNSHEYIFLLTKRPRYYYDGAAIREPVSPETHARNARNAENGGGSLVAGWAHGPGSHKTTAHAQDGGRSKKFGKSNDSFNAAMKEMPDDRNVRSVWQFPTEAFKGAHFATFPTALVERCLLAGTRPGDAVLDPFFGSGTVAQVAAGLGRDYIGLEINAKYVELFREHRREQLGLHL